MMAGVVTIEVEIQGVGGHAAAPHFAKNPTLTAAQMALSLQTLPSQLNTTDPVVVTITSIQSGFASNVIPETAKLLGTIRYMNPDLKAILQAKLKQMVEACSKIYDANVSWIEEPDGYIPTVNNPDVANHLSIMF